MVENNQMMNMKDDSDGGGWQQDGGNNHVVNLSVISDMSQKAAICSSATSDQIKVFEGDTTGIGDMDDDVGGWWQQQWVHHWGLSNCKFHSFAFVFYITY